MRRARDRGHVAVSELRNCFRSVGIKLVTSIHKAPKNPISLFKKQLQIIFDLSLNKSNSLYVEMLY